MNGLSPNATMALIGPGILAVFGIAFVCAWSIEKKRPYLLLLALACGLFGLGACSQVLGWPGDAYLNAVVSGLLYTSAVVAAAEGVLLRARKPFGWPLDLAIVAAVTGLLWYYAYVTPFLLARVYIQNFGYGAILLMAALRLRPIANARRVDRALFWILLLLALHFFPRTILTIGLKAPADARSFAMSSFWQVLQLSLAVLGAAFAVTSRAATVADIVDDLRHERDGDVLTGVLNRRGFESRVSPLLARASASRVLVLCDLDHFKSVNDTYGHGAGDEVLRTFGAILRDGLPADAIAGRLGGEEFAILLPDIAIGDAAGVAERIRTTLERARFATIPASRRITASFGIAEHRDEEPLRDLTARADQRLYAAKSHGRNRIVASDPADTPARDHSLSPSFASTAGTVAWLNERELSLSRSSPRR